MVGKYVWWITEEKSLKNPIDKSKSAYVKKILHIQLYSIYVHLLF